MQEFIAQKGELESRGWGIVILVGVVMVRGSKIRGTRQSSTDGAKPIACGSVTIPVSQASRLPVKQTPTRTR
jgi:hypothetical protein